MIHAALILDQWENPAPALKELLYHHLQRISANVRYAIAQDNNHGTSEAAALYIGGNWLVKFSNLNFRHQKCDHFARQGKKLLENRVKKLVEKDGSFSQHSVTYHRVLLDTLIFAEFWRKKFEDDLFSENFYQRSHAAINWMFILTDKISGSAPNLGPNDGTMLLNIHSCDYRNFRASLQTASLLFYKQKYFIHGLWDEPCYWLGLNFKDSQKRNQKRKSIVLPGGYVIMIGNDSWGLIRTPLFRFRPSQNDVFHFDLWYKGENICRDSGSYSYNSGNAEDDSYFKSVKAHNTVAFDDHEQMQVWGDSCLANGSNPNTLAALKV